MLRTALTPPLLATLVAGVATVVLAGTSHADTIERRGREPALRGKVEGVDEDGVRFRSELGATQVIPWDRVRSVDSGSFETIVRSQMAVAEQLWRARSRVERGDTEQAEPLLERLFTTYQGRTSETALVVAEGLLRCRLARADQALAVLPWIEVLRLRRGGIETSSYASLPPVIDPETGLAPLLPPVFMDDPSSQRIREELRRISTAPGTDPAVAELAGLYALAMPLAANGALPVSPSLPALTEPVSGKAARPEDPAAALVRLVLAAQQSDQPTREAARQRIDQLLATAAPSGGAGGSGASGTAVLSQAWSDAWLRFFGGSSRLRDSDGGMRRRGVVELLHVPARDARQLPFLSGVALWLAASAVERDGDAGSSAVLRRELDIEFPAHPLRRSAPPGVEPIQPVGEQRPL